MELAALTTGRKITNSQPKFLLIYIKPSTKVDYLIINGFPNLSRVRSGYGYLTITTAHPGHDSHFPSISFGGVGGEKGRGLSLQKETLHTYTFKLS